ncbi:hypothetical protein F0562_028799 [Nyssa sinensis]|uniref:Uncharacterized protein n=1 Tax=Nyssa sinensis TaxID=561372 RepID=A0A5J5B599_9ASTE|nr:hypothetical protein F0562_028799 [Nyssa sinensis]
MEEEQTKTSTRRSRRPSSLTSVSPDPYRPDDRYWFCLRVGCDQKHEEELDPEAVYKNFVLRVMAARSPNIRLQKALNKKGPSANIKCPLTAPAKSSKSGVSRLAVISSISQKMVDTKRKDKPLTKASSTPNARVKQVAAKYLTTPRNQKCLPNPNSFRSGPNLRPTTLAVPKNRIVAKALVFHSPKKGISVKSSVELRTPLTKICEGMKRLQITSQRKRVLGYSHKSSKDIKRDPNKSLPLNPPSGRQCKDKSRAKDSLHPQSCNNQETKSLRCMKGKDKGKYKEMVEKDSSDMDIDVKSRDGSVSKINKGNGCHEHLTMLKTSGNFGSTGSTQEEAIPCIDAPTSSENLDAMLSVSGDSREAPPSTENLDVSDDSGGEMNILSTSRESDLEENELPKLQSQNRKDDQGSERNEQEVKTKSSSEQGGSPKDHPTSYPPLEGAGHESEILDSDDKENASASTDNRNLSNSNNACERKILGRQEIHENNKKVAQTMDKNLKEGLTSTRTGAPGMKYKKPKPTNPKPFRLRTDERGILKERKIHLLAPMKEIATDSKTRHGNEMQRNEICLDQSKYNNDTHEGSKKELAKDHQNDEPQQIRTTDLKTWKEKVESKMATINPKRHSALTCQKPIPDISELEYGKVNVNKKSESSLRKTKSPSLQQQFVRPKGLASTKKAMSSYMMPAQQLSVIKETSSTIAKPKEAGELTESATPSATRASFHAASRSLSRGRSATIPKEPNFRSVHTTPKSRTRKVA